MKLRFLVFVFAILAATSVLAQKDASTAKPAGSSEKAFGLYLNPIVGRLSGTADPAENSRWRPYLMPQIGSGRSRSALSPVHKTNVQYGISAGLDYKLSKHV